MEKIIILGSGPAGYTCAIYLARAGYVPVIIEGMQAGGQLTTTTDIENYPGFPDGISGFELMDAMKAQALRFGAESKIGWATACDITDGQRSITLDSGEVMPFDVLVIATGATARYLELDSIEKLKGRGVSACAVCDGAFYRGMDVAVLGGGDTAIEEALFLTKFANKVSIIHRRDRLRASEIMGQRAMENPKIELVWDSVVEEVLDVEKNEVTGVVLRNVKTDERRTLDIQGLFMGIGHQPNTGIFQGMLDMNPQGYIVANSTKTSVPGIFAAGDVQDAVYRQAITACGSGCAAALEVQKYLDEKK